MPREGEALKVQTQTMVYNVQFWVIWVLVHVMVAYMYWVSPVSFILAFANIEGFIKTSSQIIPGHELVVKFKKAYKGLIPLIQ